MSAEIDLPSAAGMTTDDKLAALHYLLNVRRLSERFAADNLSSRKDTYTAQGGRLDEFRSALDGIRPVPTRYQEAIAVVRSVLAELRKAVHAGQTASLDDDQASLDRANARIAAFEQAYTRTVNDVLADGRQLARE